MRTTYNEDRMTDIKTLPFFPTPVSFVNFSKQAVSLNKQLIADAFDYQSKNESNKRTAVDGFQSKSNLETLYESYDTLAKYIEKVIFTIVPKLGFKQDEDYSKYFGVNTLWVNILQKNGAFHMPHTHGAGETIFTGVYYPTSGLRADNRENYFMDEDLDSDVEWKASSTPDPGDLIIFDPAMDIKRQVYHPVLNYNRYPYYGSEICVTPKQSNLIIFPNYLSHMVAPITRDNFIRMSISFACYKKYGN